MDSTELTGGASHHTPATWPLTRFEREAMLSFERPTSAEGAMDGIRVDRASDGVLYLTGDLDCESGVRLERALLAADGQGDLVLDLRDLIEWDTIGVSSFVWVAERIAPRRVVLRGSPTHLTQVLELAGLGRFAFVGDPTGAEWMLEVRVPKREGRTEGLGD
jgi:anti-anti-sigma regulatory factor